MEKTSIVFLVGLLVFAVWPSAAQSQQKHALPGSLVIGLAPEQNIFKQVKRYSPLADYISRKSGVEVKLRVFTRLGEAVDNFGHRADGAFLGSYAYVLAHRKSGVLVIARPEEPDASSFCHGLLFVRKDSGIRTVRDMKGKSFAFVDAETLTGFLLPLAYFRSHGLMHYRSFLGETYFTGTHEDAIYDVLNGKADIGAAKSSVYHRLADMDGRIGRELKILSRSPDVPDTALVLSRSVNESVRSAIRGALLNMQNDPAGREVLEMFGARRFIPATDKDYGPVLEYMRLVGLNPKKAYHPDEQ